MKCIRIVEIQKIDLTECFNLLGIVFAIDTSYKIIQIIPKTLNYLSFGILFTINSLL